MDADDGGDEAPGPCPPPSDTPTTVASALPAFLGAHAAVWTIVGVAAYGPDRPHDTIAAGALVVAAGAYEATPFKRRCRRRCREDVRSGLRFGLACVGSSAGLMLPAALGSAGVTWMGAAAVDVPFALALVALGCATLGAPSPHPGATMPM